MVVGYCGLIMFALTITAVCLKWLDVDSTSTVVTDRGIKINITTVGDCSLKECHFCEQQENSSAIDCFSGDPEELTGVEQLTSFGLGVVWLHVFQIILVPVLMAFAFIHGWSRLNSQKLSYFLAMGGCLVEWLLSTFAWAIYLGVKPTEVDGYNLGGGFWVCFVNSLLFLGMVIAVVFDKPDGLFYRQVGNRAAKSSGPSQDQGPGSDSLSESLV